MAILGYAFSVLWPSSTTAPCRDTCAAAWFRPALYREHVTAELTGSIEIIDRLQSARKRLIEMQKNDVASNA